VALVLWCCGSELAASGAFFWRGLRLKPQKTHQISPQRPWHMRKQLFF
jgi:hypothetical protein